jgi:hypothetical protein
MFSQTLLVTNESIQPPLRKKRKTTLEDNLPPSYYASEFQEATVSASALENAYA